jgi:hypothetical protein
VSSLVAAVPLAILAVLGAVWFKLHFGSVISWLGVAPAVGISVLLSLWNRGLPDGTTKSARLALAQKLTSRSLARRLWALVGAFVFLTLFMSSAHVTNEGSAVVWITRYDPTNTGVPDSMRLDSQHPRRSWRLLVLPTGRQFLMFSSDGRQTPMLRPLPWKPAAVLYPTDFDSIATVALLPAGDLMTQLTGGTPLRVILRDAQDAVIAEDSLSALRALLVSFRRPRDPDAEVRQQWLNRAVEVLSAEAAVDTSAVAPLVDLWMKSQWVRTARPLGRGESLNVVLLGAARDTVAALDITFTQAYSHVYIPRRQ